jgi:hypothetical protein
MFQKNNSRKTPLSAISLGDKIHDKIFNTKNQKPHRKNAKAQAHNDRKY